MGNRKQYGGRFVYCDGVSFGAGGSEEYANRITCAFHDRVSFGADGSEEYGCGNDVSFGGCGEEHSCGNDVSFDNDGSEEYGRGDNDGDCDDIEDGEEYGDDHDDSDEYGDGNDDGDEYDDDEEYEDEYGDEADEDDEYDDDEYDDDEEVDEDDEYDEGYQDFDYNANNGDVKNGLGGREIRFAENLTGRYCARRDASGNIVYSRHSFYGWQTISPSRWSLWEECSGLVRYGLCSLDASERKRVVVRGMSDLEKAQQICALLEENHQLSLTRHRKNQQWLEKCGILAGNSVVLCYGDWAVHGKEEHERRVCHHEKGEELRGGMAVPGLGFV